MKSVLIVVYSLLPDKFDGSDRLLLFVNQLRNYGWEPIILMHEESPKDLEELEPQLPINIDVIRTGSRIFFGLPGFVKAAAVSLRNLLSLDGQKLWELMSLRKASKIIKNGGADLIYTISPPYSSHLVGLHIRKKYRNTPWVADLGSSDRPIRHYEKTIISRIEENTDFLIASGSSIQTQELSELFEKACRAAAAKKLENITGGQA